MNLPGILVLDLLLWDSRVGDVLNLRIRDIFKEDSRGLIGSIKKSPDQQNLGDWIEHFLNRFAASSRL